LLCIALASAAAGFLCWNWPPARIFMGDAGSCFVGFMFGVLVLAGHRTGAVPLPAWLILLSIFLVDATLTLARRVVSGEKWYSPHRTHAYQLLVLAGLSHRRLALWMLGVACLLLGPLAVLVADHRALWPVAVLVLTVAAAGWAAIQLRLLASARAPRTAE
jgi:Fuc2NAc and GlcNAc transferase